MRKDNIPVLAACVMMTAYAPSVYASDKIPALEALDRYCVKTKANPVAIAHVVKQSPQAVSSDFKTIKGLPPENESYPVSKKQAWTVQQAGAPIQIAYRQWQNSTKGVNHECTILQKTPDIAALLEALETKYKLKISTQPSATTPNHYSIHFDGAPSVEVSVSK